MLRGLDIRVRYALAKIHGDSIKGLLVEAAEQGFNDAHEQPPVLFRGTPLEEAWQDEHIIRKHLQQMEFEFAHPSLDVLEMMECAFCNDESVDVCPFHDRCS